MNHVFLSYRHESPEHYRAVRRLGELLRQAEIPVELDQFYLEQHPGGPDEGGWPKWCEDRANGSACVLIIPSAGWIAVYNGTAAAGTGCGAAVEAALFRQYLYDERGDNPRLRLAFVDPLPADYAIPERLRAWHQFQPLASDADLDQLVAWIAQRLGLDNARSPTVRWPEPLADHRPDLANRHVGEWPAIVALLAGRSRERILLLPADSGYGKSEFLHQAADYARQLEIPVAKLDFKASYADVPALLGQIDLELGEHLPNFSREGGAKTHLLLRDLRALRRPVLVILDGYEKATDTFTDWVCGQLLANVDRSLGLAVIVAGHRCPDRDDVRWRGLARHLPLGPICEPADWEQWLERRCGGVAEHLNHHGCTRGDHPPPGDCPGRRPGAGRHHGRLRPGGPAAAGARGAAGGFGCRGGVALV